MVSRDESISSSAWFTHNKKINYWGDGNVTVDFLPIRFGTTRAYHHRFFWANLLAKVRRDHIVVDFFASIARGEMHLLLGRFLRAKCSKLCCAKGVSKLWQTATLVFIFFGSKKSRQYCSPRAVADYSTFFFAWHKKSRQYRSPRAVAGRFLRRNFARLRCCLGTPARGWAASSRSSSTLPLVLTKA